MLAHRMQSLISCPLIAAVVLTMAVVAVPPATRAQSAPVFTLADGDRIVLLGSTLIERAQSHGYLETALTARFHDANIQFRNLGWSGDTVFGDARAGFDTAAEGFAQLKSHVLDLKPTVILLNYGANESFAGREGLPAFVEGIHTLLTALDETGARIVFIAPPPQEKLGPPLPDPAQHNRDLQLYTAAIAKVAAERNAPLVNLFELLGKKLDPPTEIPLTDNGLHLTEYGYWRAAPVIEQALGLPPERWMLEIDARHQNIVANGMTISDAEFSPEAIRFQVLDGALPYPDPPSGSPPRSRSAVPPRLVHVFGLPEGTYGLTIDGQHIGVAPAVAWAKGVAFASGPDFEQVERLRQTIRAKNELYFYRWRPQNVTYLFGFRKHEQGQNAVEIPQFDPLVAAKEAEIHTLAAPVARRYEIVKVKPK